MEIKQKVYISGAISHHDLNDRKQTFRLAEMCLRSAGYEPVNPFNNKVDENENWRVHMRADIKLLMDCDFIFMLNGWEESKGAKLEFDVATSCGLGVLSFGQELVNDG
jgi:nucleoside 2-deoxyribosyltransferase